MPIYIKFFSQMSPFYMITRGIGEHSSLVGDITSIRLLGRSGEGQGHGELTNPLICTGWN